ncbi:hypothetical protein EDC94DRAFT_665308 [Helicostylum pulchrum]|nr:hypothetical protein EDC94DRAFT_665308 [Helicostylum pulchrum]
MDDCKLVHFDQQVAGHDKLMLMSTNDLIVVKPCKKRELDFYQDAINFPDFQDFTPECYGTVRAATEKDLKLLDKSDILTIFIFNLKILQNLCLENVLHGFTKPCILDLKMGSLLYDQDATEEKKKRMIMHSLNTTSSKIGLRLSGLKVYDTVKRRYARFEKKYGQSRTVDNVLEALLAYLFPVSKYASDAENYAEYIEDTTTEQDIIKEKIPTKYSKWVIECFIDTIKEIKESIIEHPNLRLIGSSLLFIYEGDRAAADKTWKSMLEEDDLPQNKDEDDSRLEDDELPPKMCDLRLIDFAHSDWHAERNEQDPDLINGFDNLIALLESCLQRQSQEKL